VFAYCLFHFSINGSTARRLAMIVNFLPFRQGKLTLNEILLQIDPRGDNRESLLPGLAFQLIDLFAVEKQPAVAERIMVEAASGAIGADVTVNEPGLRTLDDRIAVFQIDLSFPDGLDLGPRQLDTSLEPLQQVVKMLRLTIQGKVPGSRLKCSSHSFVSIPGGI
jgi:hypothetical protein